MFKCYEGRETKVLFCCVWGGGGGGEIYIFGCKRNVISFFFSIVLPVCFHYRSSPSKAEHTNNTNKQTNKQTNNHNFSARLSSDRLDSTYFFFTEFFDCVRSFLSIVAGVSDVTARRMEDMVSRMSPSPVPLLSPICSGNEPPTTPPLPPPTP